MSLLGELAGAVRGVARTALGGITGGMSEALYGAYKATKGKRPMVKPTASLPSSGGSAMFPLLPTAIAAGSMLLPKVPSIISRAGSLIPAAGTAIAGATRVASATWGKLPRWSKEAAMLAGFSVVGSMVLDGNGQPVGRVGGRRINPMNAKAARRAIRRIKGARKILQNIEKSLPRARRR